MTPAFEDARLLSIRDKVEARERLTFDDAIALYRTPDLLGVGWMALALGVSAWAARRATAPVQRAVA